MYVKHYETRTRDESSISRHNQLNLLTRLMTTIARSSHNNHHNGIPVLPCHATCSLSGGWAAGTQNHPFRVGGSTTTPLWGKVGPRRGADGAAGAAGHSVGSTPMLSFPHDHRDTPTTLSNLCLLRTQYSHLLWVAKFLDSIP